MRDGWVATNLYQSGQDRLGFRPGLEGVAPVSLSRDPGFALKQALLANLRDARWQAGEKLPTERQMCTLYNVGRSTVRRVLGEMKALGLVTQTVGSGTYVARNVAEQAAACRAARHRHQPGGTDGGAADLRARTDRSGDPQRFGRGFRRPGGMLPQCRTRPDTLQQFEIWDDAFHRALAAATHNGFVVSVFALVSKVRDDGEWGLLKQRSAMPERRAEYQREHWAILAALRQRDAGVAREALVNHLIHVRRNMFGD